MRVTSSTLPSVPTVTITLILPPTLVRSPHAMSLALTALMPAATEARSRPSAEAVPIPARIPHATNALFMVGHDTRTAAKPAIGLRKSAPSRVDQHALRHILRLLCSYRLTCQLGWPSSSHLAFAASSRRSPC